MPSRLILVLGPHRSGTSVVARSLMCLGGEVGPLAEWTGPDNPLGFFEDREILSLNDAILRAIGRPWDDPRPIDGVMRSAAMARAAPYINAILTDRMAKYPIFIAKEPRLCRLLHLYRPFLSDLDCEVSVVHVVRHPLASARSLLARNGIPLSRGLALWLEYTKRAREDADPAWKTVTVHMGLFMANPVQQIARMGAELGLPADMDETYRFADHFVDFNLWHDHVSGEPLPSDVAEMWERLQQEG